MKIDMVQETCGLSTFDYERQVQNRRRIDDHCVTAFGAIVFRNTSLNHAVQRFKTRYLFIYLFI